MEESRAAIAMEAFSNFANSFGPDNDELIKEFKRKHRTLQQNMVRSMMKLIEAIADDSYGTDARNEQSKQLCKRLVDGFQTQLPDEQKGYKPSEFLSFI